MADHQVYGRLSRWSGLVMLLAVVATTSIAAQDSEHNAVPAQPPITATPPRAVGAGLLPEPKLLTRGIEFAVDKFGDDGDDRKEGFYPELSNMNTGAGFVSLGPGYRRYFLDDLGFVDTSAALSWRFYKMAQARVEFPELADGHLILGTQIMWQDQTQVRYFGIGSDSLEADESLYRLQHVDVVGYAAAAPNDSLTIGGVAGWVRRPRLLSPGGTFKPDLPDAASQFPDEPGFSTDPQPNFFHAEAYIISDTRDYPNHPTSGGLYRAVLTKYQDQSSGTFSFLQYQGEAAHFIPLADSRWVLALRGWLVASDVPAGHDVPFYLLPSLGGHNTLRDYSNYRFHDRALAVVNAESRLAIFAHLDGALFVDAGNVAPRLQDLNLDKVDYGAGLRLHADGVTFARFDGAYGDEGWKFMFRTSDPFRLSRLTRRVGRIPFAP